MNERNKTSIRTIKYLGAEFVLPYFKMHPAAKHLVRKVHVNDLIAGDQYSRRLPVLRALRRNHLSCILCILRASYSDKVNNPLSKVSRAIRYKLLYESICKNGIISNKKDALSMPWLFASDSICVRLDGSHRASIARFLGYQEMNAVVLTPLTLMDLLALPEEYKNFLSRLEEPSFT